MFVLCFPLSRYIPLHPRNICLRVKLCLIRPLRGVHASSVGTRALCFGYGQGPLARFAFLSRLGPYGGIPRVLCILRVIESIRLVKII